MIPATAKGREPDKGLARKSGFFSGLLASLCCVGAALAIAFGIAGGTLGLVRYRLEFLVMGGVLMLFSFALAARRTWACCAPPMRRRRLGQLLAALLTSFALTYILGTWLVPNALIAWTASGIAPAGSGNTAPVAGSFRQVTLDIEGMYCPACIGLVRQVLKATPGVMDAKASLAGRGWAVYDPARVTAEQLATAVSLYFPTRVRADEAYSP